MDDRLRVSRKQEREVAERFGARQHAGSGSGFVKHDSHTTNPPGDDRAVNSGLLIECKTQVGSAKRQILIKADDLKSVERVALRQGRTPVLIFDLAGRRYAVLLEEDLLEMNARGLGGHVAGLGEEDSGLDGAREVCSGRSPRDVVPREVEQ